MSGRVIVGTGGYIGDAPPYQGHIVAIEPGSGRIAGVTNTLCADRHEIIAPASCQSSDSAIWSRSGAVELPDKTLLVTTGNAPFDGRNDFGDSVVRVSADARRLLGSWTPSNYAELESGDVDLGSTGPVVIGGGSILQSGKDGRLHVFAVSALDAPGTVGHERQNIPAPGGTGMFTAPAVWKHGGETWVFTTTDIAIDAYVQRGGRLVARWTSRPGGTSPIVAGGVLWLYDPAGHFVAYAPTTGKRLAQLPIGDGHWNSPTPGAGVIAVPEGNANEHTEDGVLNLYSKR
jgi:outer membrane protein assembly factor BamB